MKPEDFKKLTRAEQRVQIAKDIISQIKRNKLTPAQAGYIHIRGVEKGSIQKNMSKITCTACALGSCLLSIVKFKNSLDVEDLGYDAFDFWDSEKIKKLLHSIFTTSQLALIEAAFEDGGYAYAEEVSGFKLSPNKVEKTQDFYNDYDTASDRLTAIMQNIIKNKGKFVL